ncbi:1-acyl-sn-glycerol-3-phosphate acyltransferase [Streptomyces griseochromogenes]|uniref:1-acyl-sn-glycerol-3-phosphate acyltransferase n=1 Tax=Streptomyces griseochromogenes TaxID=68214 RepID=A0ABS4LWL9_9ACTN|nr:lysophospholipid acyltransferase family protein [Streptomyces griseochromogenes]MBP2051819.1 1-acyl-sn-glycerol-3-phosphate acyltransferase [Streptomyces griseochromogenes]
MSRRRIGFWYRFAAVLCKPPLVVLIKRDWRGMENIPAEGGFITAVNHNSHVDPFAYAHYQYNTGRVPRFLAKSGLFKKGFVGAAMRGTGQIPVYRESTDALSAFRAAIDAVERGECVAFYPEGTLTRDPDGWPMTAKTGAARVALQTKCPVIPVAQWGCNELLPPYAKKPHLFPRKTHRVLAGPPVDLSRFYDQEMTADLLKEATEVIMAAITRQLEEIRGEKAPETPYDPRRERIEQRRKTRAQTGREVPGHGGESAPADEEPSGAGTEAYVTGVEAPRRGKDSAQAGTEVSLTGAEAAQAGTEISRGGTEEESGK